MKIKPSNQWLYFIIFVSVVIIGAVWLIHRSSYVLIDNAQFKAELLTVRSRVDGQVIYSDISSRYSQVEKGRVMVVLDDVDIEAKVVALKTKIAETDAQIQVLTADKTDDLALARVEQVQNDLKKRRLSFEYKQKKAELMRSSEMLERVSTLERRGYSTLEALKRREEEVEEDITQQAAIRAALDQADEFDEELIIRQRKIDRTSLKVKGLEETKAGLQSELKILEERRGHYTFHSTYDGVVNEIYVQQGDFITQSQRLFTIHSPDSLYLEAKVFEADIHRFNLGATVQISVDAYPGKVLAGTVERIGSLTTSQSTVLPDSAIVPNFIRIRQLIPIRIKIDEPQIPLIPGLLATVKLKK